MSRAKTERLLNLVLCLLSTRRFLSKEQIYRAVPGYPESAEAFARAFERDKDELRSMGVPVQTGVNEVLFDDEPGYRIPQDAYALPEISLTTHEWAVVELAAQAWQSNALGADAQRAINKLRAEVPAFDGEQLAGQHSGQGLAETGGDQSTQTEPGQQVDLHASPFASLMGEQLANTTGDAAATQALAALTQAVADRQAVSFAYQKPRSEQAQQRTVQPWGLVAQRGRWYVVGFDQQRDARRVFRLARVQGQVQVLGRPGQFEVPAGVDLGAEVASVQPPAVLGTARLALAPDAGSFFRRGARELLVGSHPAPGAQVAQDHDACSAPRWDEVVIDYSDPGHLAAQVAGLAGKAVVLAPVQVGQLVLEHLRQAVAPSQRNDPHTDSRNGPHSDPHSQSHPDPGSDERRDQSARHKVQVQA